MKDLSGFFRLAKTNQGRTLSFTPSDVYQLRNRSDALERLTKFLVKFEIEKGLLSVGDRHQLHRDFLDLVQYYREENYEPQAIQLAQELTNHAFKIPEGKCTYFDTKNSLLMMFSSNSRDDHPKQCLLFSPGREITRKSSNDLGSSIKSIESFLDWGISSTSEQVHS